MTEVESWETSALFSSSRLSYNLSALRALKSCPFARTVPADIPAVLLESATAKTLDKKPDVFSLRPVRTRQGDGAPIGGPEGRPPRDRHAEDSHGRGRGAHRTVDDRARDPRDVRGTGRGRGDRVDRGARDRDSRAPARTERDRDAEAFGDGASGGHGGGHGGGAPEWMDDDALGTEAWSWQKATEATAALEERRKPHRATPAAAPSPAAGAPSALSASASEPTALPPPPPIAQRSDSVPADRKQHSSADAEADAMFSRMSGVGDMQSRSFGRSRFFAGADEAGDSEDADIDPEDLVGSKLLGLGFGSRTSTPTTTTPTPTTPSTAGSNFLSLLRRGEAGDAGPLRVGGSEMLPGTHLPGGMSASALESMLTKSGTTAPQQPSATQPLPGPSQRAGSAGRGSGAAVGRGAGAPASAPFTAPAPAPAPAADTAAPAPGPKSMTVNELFGMLSHVELPPMPVVPAPPSHTPTPTAQPAAAATTVGHGPVVGPPASGAAASGDKAQGTQVGAVFGGGSLFHGPGSAIGGPPPQPQPQPQPAARPVSVLPAPGGRGGKQQQQQQQQQQYQPQQSFFPAQHQQLLAQQQLQLQQQQQFQMIQMARRGGRGAGAGAPRTAPDVDPLQQMQQQMQQQQQQQPPPYYPPPGAYPQPGPGYGMPPGMPPGMPHGMYMPPPAPGGPMPPYMGGGGGDMLSRLFQQTGPMPRMPGLPTAALSVQDLERGYVPPK